MKIPTSPLPDIDPQEDAVPESLLDSMEDIEDAAIGVKLQLFLASTKKKLSCCFGGEEETKSGFIGKIKIPGM